MPDNNNNKTGRYALCFCHPILLKFELEMF